MDVHRVFLDEILAHPDDDAPRLVYADWLSEREDPRGEFIRLQCERERLPQYSLEAQQSLLRERELASRHGREWAGELHEMFYPYRFRRGFIAWGRSSTHQFVPAAERVLRMTPLERLVLARGAMSEELASQPFMSRLQSVTLQKFRSTEESSERFLRRLGRRPPAEVSLSECVGATRGLHWLRDVQSLRLYDTHDSDVRDFLAAAPPRLHTFVVGRSIHDQHPLSLGDVVQQLGHCYLRRLEVFGQIEEDELGCLSAGCCEGLKHLLIPAPSRADVEALARLESVRLTSFSVEHSALPPTDTLEPLLSAAPLQQLRALKLRYLQLPPRCADELVAWQRFPELVSLDLLGTSMEPGDASMLLTAASPPQRSRIRMSTDAMSLKVRCQLREQFPDVQWQRAFYGGDEAVTGDQAVVADGTVVENEVDLV
ncbi:MAG: TIGR02996 domain-containing protein [Planctomycetales bacterium]|nr:TIGR02996 domain-containing protein [Planctomycetales bacterium]